MQVDLVRRWGPHRAGRTVDVSETQGQWLVQHGYATASEVAAPVQEPVAEGTHGADPLAGGDATRRRPHVTHIARDPEVNTAAPGEGVPATYRPGYGAEDRARESRAGRRVTAPQKSSQAERPAGSRRRKTKPAESPAESSES